MGFGFAEEVIGFVYGKEICIQTSSSGQAWNFWKVRLGQVGIFFDLPDILRAFVFQEKRPPTPELKVLQNQEIRHLALLRAPGKEPKAKRATAYLGVSEDAPVQRETIPRQYKFDEQKQAYIHDDKDSEVIHNVTCAIDLNYEPSSICTNVSLYYLTIRHKQASQG